MLDPRSFDDLPEEIVKIFQELEDYVISDICRRLREEGYITATAEIRLSSLLSLGMSDAGIRQAITKALGISEAKLEELYQAAAKESQRFDNEVYKRRGQEAVRLKDNDRLQTAIRAQAAQTQGEFDNFTGSLGFSVLQAGRRVFLPASEGYRHALNRAQVEIISGQSPLEAMKRAVRELAKSGLRTVDYASGRHDQLDVAVRRATVTGLHQVSDKVTDEDAELFESPLVEVSAHGGARDTGSGFQNHKQWQGKVYYWREKDRWGRHDLAGRYPDFVSTTGYGDVRGFGGANCRHSKRVFVDGVSQRMYTAEQLRKIDKPPFAYKGVTYTAYQATQRQRELERMQRYYKRILIGYEAAGIGPDDKDYQNAAIRLQVASQEYKAFSAAAGLIRQPERAQVEGFGKGQAAAARRSAGRAAADQKEFAEYQAVLGKNAPKTFAEFRNLKYNDGEKWKAFQAYKKAVQTGELTPLADFSLYQETSREIDEKLVGLTTSNGIQITGKSNHFISRTIGSVEQRRSGVPVDKSLEALTSKEATVLPVKIFYTGDVSQRFIFGETELSINPKTGNLVQVNPFSRGRK